MAWQLLVVLAAIGVLVVGLVWKASQWNIRDHDYEPLAVVSGGETDTENGRNEVHEQLVLLRGPPQLLGTITTLWLWALLHCETMTWQRLVASLPGYLFGTYLALGFEWKHRREQSWTWEEWLQRNHLLTVIITMAIPLFLWLMGLPFIDVPWYLVVVQAISAILETFGLRRFAMAADTNRKEEEALGGVAGLAGLFVASIGALAIFTFTWQLALFALPGCLWVMFFGYNIVSSDRREAWAVAAVMAWCFSLPVLHATGLWWLFLLLELMAFLVFARPTVEFQSLHDRHEVMFTGLLLGLLSGSLAVLAMWSSGGWSWASWPSVFRDLWPLDLYLVPFTLFAIWCLVEVCVHCQFGTRSQLITRINILLVLAMLPLVLQIDVPELQSRVPSLDLMPTDHVDIDVRLNVRFSKFQVNLRNSTVPFLQMPRPLWPTSQELALPAQNRTSFWPSYMLSKYLLAVAMSVLVLSALACPRHEGELEALSDSQRDVLTILLVVAQLLLCTKLSLTAGWFGQLTANGLDFEGYDTCLRAGLLWFIAQAFSLRILNLRTCYDPRDVALSSLSLLPFLGDPFDTLKDTMLAGVALTSRVWWVKILGGGALLYLWTLHLGILLPKRSNRLELQQSYLAIFSLKAPGKEQGHSYWFKMLTVIYKQSTPARLWAMLVEDVPQGLLACAVSSADGFTTFMFVTNIAVPAVRICLAWAFHYQIAWKVREWILQEAVDAVEEGKATLSDEFTAALLRLQAQYQENLKTVQWSRAKEQVKPLIAEGEEAVERAFHEFSVLNWISMQNLPEGGEETVTVYRALLLVVLEDARAMDGLVTLSKLWKHQSLRIRHERESESDPVIGVPGCRALARGIGQMQQHLTNLELDLSGNQIGNDGCTALAHGVSKLQCITNLNLHLSENKIGKDGFQALADAISKLQITGLFLNVSENGIGDAGCTALAHGVSKLQCITNLNLSLGNNQIGKDGCTALAHGVSKLQYITNLNLSLGYNQIGKDGCTALAHGVSKLQCITNLNLGLGDNQIGKDGCTALAKGLCQLQQVTKILLWLWGKNEDQGEAAKLKSRLEAHFPSAEISVWM